MYFHPPEDINRALESSWPTSKCTATYLALGTQRLEEAKAYGLV